MYRTIGSVKLYDIFIVLSGAALFIFNLLNLNKKKQIPGKIAKSLISLSKKQQKSDSTENIIIAFEIIFISFFQFVLSGSMNSVFNDIFDTGANYFGLLFSAPFFVAIICFILGEDFYKTFDLITPAYPLALIFTKLACFCSGCCRGFECSFGLFNHKTNALEFPVQLVEATLACIIFIFLIHKRKNAKEGTMFPIYLIVYSSTRFFSEFFRHEEDIFWILKKYHFFCLAGIVLGIIEYFITVKYIDCIKSFLDKAFEAMVLWLNKSVIKNHFKKEKKVIIHHNKKKKKNQKKTTYRK